MCYARPGPRCASSAFKRLVRISRSEGGEFSREQMEEAVLDYYSTPAGMSLITVREQQGMDTTDIPMSGFTSMKTSELKKMLEAYRSRKMAAMSPTSSPIPHPRPTSSLSDVNSDFVADDVVRVHNDDIRSAYVGGVGVREHDSGLWFCPLALVDVGREWSDERLPRRRNGGG